MCEHRSGDAHGVHNFSTAEKLLPLEQEPILFRAFFIKIFMGGKFCTPLLCVP
jgi:hypothetical protein